MPTGRADTLALKSAASAHAPHSSDEVPTFQK